MPKQQLVPCRFHTQGLTATDRPKLEGAWDQHCSLLLLWHDFVPFGHCVTPIRWQVPPNLLPPQCSPGLKGCR